MYGYIHILKVEEQNIHRRGKLQIQDSGKWGDAPVELPRGIQLYC